MQLEVNKENTDTRHCDQKGLSAVRMLAACSVPVETHIS